MQKYVLGSALALAAVAGHAAQAQTITYTFTACIDGDDRLFIQGGQVWWQYIDHTAVGDPRPECNSYTTISTTLNGNPVITNGNVQPVWNPDPPYPGDYSLPFQPSLSPALPSTDMNVTLTVLQGRDSLTIAQYPNAANGQTLVLDFNDDTDYGATLYTAHVTITPAVPAYSCNGFTAPFNVPLSLKSKTNRAIPLAAQLLDVNDKLVTSSTLAGAAPPVVNIDYSSATVPATDETSLLDPVGQSSTGNQFNFDSTAGDWWFNLSSTPIASSGTYTVTMQSGDVTKYTLTPQCSGVFTRQ